MDRFDENMRDALKPLGFRDVPRTAGRCDPDVSAKNRRALRDVKNLMNDPHTWAVGKRGGNSDKTAAAEKKANNNVCGVPFAARRPITRRFAATLKSQSGFQCDNAGKENNSSTVQPPPPSLGNAGKENDSRTVQPPPLMSSQPSSMDTSNLIDVDDYKSFDYVPMYEEDDEEMQCDPKEVEMEDIVTELKPDIDGSHRDNPLAVVEYVEAIYNVYRELEKCDCVSPDYMSKQFDINEKMRAILIDWLIEVHYKFELMDETLYLTVNIIDRFLEKEAVVRKKLQLVGVTAMLLACKYEEVSVPVVEDLILISDRAYTRKEVLDMEKLIVNTLEFNMSVPTPYVFMRRFLKAANSDSDNKLELLSFFIIELCLVEYRMLKFKPSLLAAAAVYTAQSALLGLNHWTKISELHTSYKEEQLQECSRMMVDFHQKAGTGKLTGVHRKYSTFKFGFAARCEPALFLLDTMFL